MTTKTGGGFGITKASLERSKKNQKPCDEKKEVFLKAVEQYKKGEPVSKVVSSMAKEFVRIDGARKASGSPFDAKNSGFLEHEAWMLILSGRELQLLNDPKALSATGKLLKLKTSGKVVYKPVRGRSSVGPYQWMQLNLVDAGHLTSEELKCIPEWVFGRFDPRLVQAIRDSRRGKTKQDLHTL